MIPLYELASKVLPNMEDQIIKPIKSALEYYKGLQEAEKKALLVTIVAAVLCFFFSLSYFLPKSLILNRTLISRIF